jgi:5-hydroxyisourate hydrolase
VSLSTHVLDTAAGRPAAGVAVTVEIATAGGWDVLAERVTDRDGRVGDLLASGAMEPGTYRLSFATGAYFAARRERTFWPRVAVEFTVSAPQEHHHVPLLVSPHGYTTYRGS